MTTRSIENLPWVEKYRPSAMSDIYGQKEIVVTLEKFVDEGKLPHLLFYGPPGTGKTSTVLAMAKRIYGPQHYKSMILELNASDDRGIDVVREQVKNFASTMQIFNKGFKLIILDEADSMTNVAQNALRRIIEKYTKNARFVILANYAHKLNPALLSRCTRFRFQPLQESAIQERIKYVCEKETLKVSEPATDALLKLSKGDMRKSLNVLQACQSALDDPSNDEVTKEMVYECIGNANPDDINSLLDSILKEDFTTSYLYFEKVTKSKGLAIIDILSGIIEILDSYKLKPQTRVKILKRLSEIEYGISKGGNTKIQSSAVIATIKDAMVGEAY
ncbi:replication factor C subunit 3 [Saccharomycopsis crataegensis]|uniref:Replication factor C subunit 3 n=1 Tax=Saccharomycopsis crataegensis TaxID=43959 RepID=A0AAV5QNL4_9ASCO|nr:replication factor C subunit 3 [Saccharomycopsis crataegensis]